MLVRKVEKWVETGTAATMTSRLIMWTRAQTVTLSKAETTSDRYRP